MQQLYYCKSKHIKNKEMKNYAILLLIILSIFSCKKDDNVSIDPPAPAPLPVYMPMEVGNYWVYQSFKVENSGETPLDKYDSLVITHDTMIRDHKYFVFEGTAHSSIWHILRTLRDSASYYVFPNGDIYFTDQKRDGEVYFEHTSYMPNLIDTVWSVKNYNESVEQSITFPIGDFKVLNRRSDYTTFPGDPDFADSLKYRKTNSYFIEDIGQANYYVFYASADFHYDKRLIRYRIIKPIGD